MLRQLKGMSLKDRAMHPIDAWWDLRLGISTFGYQPAVGDEADPDLRVHYTPTPYRLIRAAFQRVGVGSNDVVVDLGSGLARTVFLAAWMGARKAVGVEINPVLAEGAERNRKRFQLPGKDIRIAFMSAADYDHAETTVVFMYHPFGEGTLRHVLNRIEQGLAQRPRHLRIVYLNPVHGSVLDGSRHLRRLDHWEPPRLASRNARCPLTFWESVPTAS